MICGRAVDIMTGINHILFPLKYPFSSRFLPPQSFPLKNASGAVFPSEGFSPWSGNTATDIFCEKTGERPNNNTIYASLDFSLDEKYK